MAHDCTTKGLERQASDRMAQTIRHAFCNTMTASGLPPITVLRLAAAAVGVIYREAVAAHEGPNGCPCGWEPEPGFDLLILQEALAVSGLTEAGMDLRTMQPAGQA